VEKALKRAFEGETLRLEVQFRHCDSSWRWAEILFYPLRENGVVTAVTTLSSDVTEKRLLGNQLREAQKMEALGAMGGGIAHDFNNLLASIQGNLELATRKTGAGHAAERNLAEAAKAARRASEHCRQILGFSRKSVLDPKPVDLNEVCREAVALIRPTVDPRIEFVVIPRAGLWSTVGDAGELVQVLVNLILNARDALPDGGRVVLETSNVVLDGSQARGHPDARAGEYVGLELADDGPGMSAEVQARIFEPFFTTKPAGQGTGLGLAMVYGTAKRHGGWVQCLSEPGLGTRFSLYLPREKALVSEAAEAAEPLRGGSETILLVDDEEALRTMGVEALEDLGYSVITARDGIEAVEVFSRERERIRLVILDLSMPRMGGRDALPRLKQVDPAVRVLVTTGHSPEDEAEKLLGQGIVGLIPKPYRLEEIGRSVRSALDV
jgi:signal transduction histidine kinase/CheY-like chemotaxis protein